MDEQRLSYLCPTVWTDLKYKNRYDKLLFLQRFIEKYVDKIKKAAPRFELGIKDLQSSALPLGHTARVYITIKQIVIYLLNNYNTEILFSLHIG